MYKIFLPALLCFFTIALSAQTQTAKTVPAPDIAKAKPKNLVLNPGFETLRDSSSKWQVGNPIDKAAAWSSPNQSRANVYTSVKKSGKSVVYDPYGPAWDFSARTGNNVAGFNVAKGHPKYGKRGYIQGELKEPLTVGKKYYFGFWVHYHCEGANNIGITFLPERAQMDSTLEILPFEPATRQIKVANYSKDRTWTLVRDSFVAYKPYRYFVIGNFFPDSLTEVQDDVFKHYFAFIDDILVMEAENQAYNKPVDQQIEEKKWVKNVVTSKSVNATFILRNIYFDYDKSSLLSASDASLNELLEQMKASPGLKIKIKGHTSTEGDSAYNLKLSQNRAKAVRNWLVKNGVAAERVQYEGYGETRPIGPNDTEENRAQNRRVEFEILEK